MGMQTDVKSTYLTADGNIFDGPARIRGVLISPSTSAGSLIIKDGGTGGTVVFETNWASNTTPAPFNVVIPAEGIRCETSAYADVTTLTSVTVFYG